MMGKAGWNLTVLFCLFSLAHGSVIRASYPHSNDANVVGIKEHRTVNNNYDVRVHRGIDRTRNRESRLSEAEWSSYDLREMNGPGSYVFGYDNVVDPSGNEQFRFEERLQNGTVLGEYGYTDYRNRQIVRVSYVADHLGYRAKTNLVPLDDF